MGRFYKRFLVGLLLLTFSCGLSTSTAHASVNDFTVTNFSADYYLSKLTPHGHMDVTEQIGVDFHDYNHGILRAIPNSYHGHPLHLKIDSVSSPTGTPSQYTTYASNNNTVLKIGDLSRTVTGSQSYLIKYSLDNVITVFKDHDELFWDINGDQWAQPFTSVTAKYHIPADLASQLQDKTLCYSGGFGDTSQNCLKSVSAEDDSKVLVFSAQNLSAYQTLSTVIGFGSATFAPYSWRDAVSEHKADIIISAISATSAWLVFRRWLRWGKDPKSSGIIVPQYGPPKGTSVLDAGILQDYKLDNKDVTAIIIDLAIRGCVTIVEQDKKTLIFKTGTTTSLTLNKTDSKLTDYELKLLQTLFDPALEPGSTISLGKYISGMQGTIQSVGKESLERLTDAGFFDGGPERPGYGLQIVTIFACVVMIVAGFWSQNFIGGLVSIAALLLIIMLVALMPRRTKMGVMFNDDLMGLKMYLSVAEADRIKMLQSPGAKYAGNAKDPKRTVQLFEKLLPFAIILGVEKQWAGQFENIYKEPPTWYNGNWSTFNTVMLASHINSATSNFNASFSPASSSSSSGFSGGGSGGGGGGGGGGGW